MDFYQEFFSFLSTHIMFAPYLIFGLLLLAGLNVPISEDLMLLFSALLAKQFPQYLIPFFLGVYLGAYISDIICFFLGKFIGERIFSIPFLGKMASKEQIQKIQGFYAKYGIWALIVGRFIPFGVRNALFLSAGIGKMKTIKFIMSDWIACTLSCSLFFTLYYQFGEQAIAGIKKANGVIFGFFIAFLVLFFILKKIKRKNQF